MSLHGLAGGALGQVVKRRADDDAARDAVLHQPDEGHVGAAHVAGMRHRAERQHMHERLVGVALASIACRSAAEAVLLRT